jgi:anti-sigma factor RsiW
MTRWEPREEELAALADGTLAPEKAAALEERVAESPELAARLDEQRRVVALVHEAGADVVAHSALRARIEAQRRERRTFGGLRWPVGIAAAAAVAALAVLLVLPEDVPGGPSVAEAAALGTLPPLEGAPSASPAEPKLLAEDVQGVAFPNWLAKFGWDATGVRRDTIEDRPATTVYYEKDGRRIAYTIVGGEALQAPGDAVRAEREGTELQVFDVGGRTVVTWERLGRTCILSGAGVDRDVLLDLAGWKGMGSVEF